MKAFLSKYKGYLLHAAAVGVVFLTPSVQHVIAANPGYSAIAGAAWGFLLHWADGQK
jgi:hypothetical protein